jgi:hypothetical protein
MNKLKVETIRYYKKAPLCKSKFSAKRKVIYVLPSLDMCIGMLPKEVGNHILSYTTAWFDFMLFHILEKYGLPFFKKLICEFVVPGYRWNFKKHHTGIDIIKLFNNNFHRYSDSIRKNVANNIKRALDYRQQQIILKTEQAKIKRIQKKISDIPIKEYMATIEIGSVIKLGCCIIGIAIVINKTPLYLTTIICRNFRNTNGVMNCRWIYGIDCIDKRGYTDEEFLPVSKITLKNNVELIFKKSKRASKKTEQSILKQIKDAEEAPFDENAYEDTF